MPLPDSPESGSFNTEGDLMVYTFNSGLKNEVSENAAKIGAVILPGAALIFLFLAILSFNTHQATGRSPIIPTKPAVSAKTNQPKLSGPATPPPVAVQTSNPVPLTVSTFSFAQPATVGSSSAPLVPTTGGMGGGTGSSGSTTTPTTSGSGTGSIVCTNTLSLAQICTVCAPPLTLQPGQKAILSSDGSCVAVN